MSDEFIDQVALRFLDNMLSNIQLDADAQDMKQEAKNIADCVWQYTQTFVPGKDFPRTISKEEIINKEPPNHLLATSMVGIQYPKKT